MAVVDGGKMFWARREAAPSRGVVVLFVWVSLSQQQLHSFIHLLSPFPWNVLVCSSRFFTLFNPGKAGLLAAAVINELIEELRRRPCPVVFVAFSGGAKACLCKVFQILQKTYEAHLAEGDVNLVKNCVSGHIFDSAPVDFTRYIGSHLSMLPRLGSWIARGLGCGLDALFLTDFESQMSDYWEALYASVGFGAPYLILCSEDDHRAPYREIFGFSRRLRDLGGEVKLITWPGHYGHHTEEYRGGVESLLENATAVYSSKKAKRRALTKEPNDEISELISGLQKAMADGVTSVTQSQYDRFVLNKSRGIRDDGDSRALSDEPGGGPTLPLGSRPGGGAHGILGQALFDVCIPKNVEGWDVRFDARRRSPVDVIKRMCRSRL